VFVCLNATLPVLKPRKVEWMAAIQQLQGKILESQEIRVQYTNLRFYRNETKFVE